MTKRQLRVSETDDYERCDIDEKIAKRDRKRGRDKCEKSDKETAGDRQLRGKGRQREKERKW